MPIPKPTDDYRLRHGRVSAIGPQRPIKETIERAKLYIEDRVWLSPVELKATIRQLATTLEAILANPTPAPGPARPSRPKVAVAPSPPPELPKPTHVGHVLGLKGRNDYEALLVSSGQDRLTDQHGRSFDLKDYGYDEDEAYRLDLSSLREL